MGAMIKVERFGPVLTVSLNRPEVRNALNEELINALYEIFSTVSREIRVIVLSGEGTSFCAGGDLEWMKRAANYSEEENKQDAIRLAKMFQAIRNCHAVTIASLHGHVMGGGTGIVAACDIAIATEDTKFAFSEVKLGLIPATISPIVIDKIGKGHARALFVTGEVFEANHAFRIGLIHEVIPAREREGALHKKIRFVLSAGPEAIVGAKNLVFDSPLSIDETAERLAKTRMGQEAISGMNAFLEKQSAPFVVAVPEMGADI